MCVRTFVVTHSTCLEICTKGDGDQSMVRCERPYPPKRPFVFMVIHCVIGKFGKTAGFCSCKAVELEKIVERMVMGGFRSGKNDRAVNDGIVSFVTVAARLPTMVRGTQRSQPDGGD